MWPQRFTGANSSVRHSSPRPAPAHSLPNSPAARRLQRRSISARTAGSDDRPRHLRNHSVCSASIAFIPLRMLLSACRLATSLMPCYGCQLKLFTRTRPTHLSNTINVACHGNILTGRGISTLLLGVALSAFAPLASPQLSSAPQPGNAAPPPSNQATVERPDFSVKIPRIDPPSRGEYDFQFRFPGFRRWPHAPPWSRRDRTRRCHIQSG